MLLLIVGGCCSIPLRLRDHEVVVDDLGLGRNQGGRHLFGVQIVARFTSDVITR